MASSTSTSATRGPEPLDLEAIHDFAASLAVRAGALLATHAYQRARSGHPDAKSLNQREKDSSVDIVTDIDVAVEQFVLEEIRKHYPVHHVLAEESYSAGGSRTFELPDEPTWIVDPLDGTVNFVHLFPLICVSIGLAVRGQPVVGAIYAPLLGGLDGASRGTLWSSCQGRGAWQSHPRVDQLETTSLASLTSTASSSAPLEYPRPLRLPLAPLRPLPANAPSGLLFGSEWGKDRRTHEGSNLLRKANTFLNLASARHDANGRRVHGIRSLGSAALDLAYCATGALDVVWEGGCWEWDVCAGLAILTEAGGIWTDANAPPKDSQLYQDKTQPIPRVPLGARRFLCIRPCSDGDDESARQAQERVVRVLWDALELGGLDYQRDGVVYPASASS